MMVVLTFMPVHALLLTHGKRLLAFRAEEAHGATVERDEAFFQPVSFGDEAVHVSQSSLVQRQEETININIPIAGHHIDSHGTTGTIPG